MKKLIMVFHLRAKGGSVTGRSAMRGEKMMKQSRAHAGTISASIGLSPHWLAR